MVGNPFYVEQTRFYFFPVFFVNSLGPLSFCSHGFVMEKEVVERFTWPAALVKCFISVYDTHKWKFSSVDFKAKRVWEAISEELKTSGLPGSGQVDWKICSNKWKSLTSAFHKTVDHNATTGRERKHCPFEKELSEVYGYRRNVNPVATCSVG